MSAGLYGGSLALLTDLYQLTMAAAAFRSGIARREGVFNLHFRRAPFGGGFAIAAGLGPALDFVEALRFADDDLAYLATLRTSRGTPLFDDAFLRALEEVEGSVDIDAIPEGTPVFAQEPLLRVSGPLVPCLLLESPLLALVNFQTLVATKAARLFLAARGEPVLEFGLRRAQGIDGAVSASRAAYVGGAAATSNALAGKLFGIPVAGTHAHSWVLAFDSEPEAFEAYARAMPDNALFLVDTVDTLAGVDHAIEAGLRLRERGHELLGVRLDSGDLAWLSREARRKLDAAGFPEARVLASNDLDEHLVQSLREQGARIAVWGVGTRLATGAPDAALGGVYKLAAIREPGGPWLPRLKVSEQAQKIGVPGVVQVRRFSRGGELAGDQLYDLGDGPSRRLIDPFDATRWKDVPPDAAFEDLLVPAARAGRRLSPSPPLAELRARTLAGLARLPEGVKRFANPHAYPVGLEPRLFERRTGLILQARAAVSR